MLKFVCQAKAHAHGLIFTQKSRIPILPGTLYATAPPDDISWNKAIAIAACDKHFLAGTGAEYLEADLHQKALEIGKYIIANRAPIEYPSCADVDQYAYIRFLAEVYMLIRLAGFDIFEGSETDPDIPLHITFKNYKHKVEGVPTY